MVPRQVRLAVALAAALAAVSASESQAQVGYGYPGGYGNYGWGGWGGGVGTVQGNYARGLGAYQAAAGAYNEETAIANSVNADTVMRWNEYLYQSQRVANRREHLRLARRAARDASSGDLVHERLLKNPTAEDIADGSALNVVLEQLSDPSIHSSSLRQGTAKLPGKLVRAIPFLHASESVSISLDQLTAEEGWPIALRGENFASERKAYSAAIDKALEEDHEGEITPESLKSVQESLGALRAKLKTNPPTDRAETAEADRYIRTLVGMTRMLERPEIDKVVSELDQTKETTLGNMLGFMQTFNLRFGPSKTPEQRAAYETIYPGLVALRDQVVAPAEKSTNNTTAKKVAPRNDKPTGAPVDFFSGMKLHELEGKPAPKLQDRKNDK